MSDSDTACVAAASLSAESIASEIGRTLQVGGYRGAWRWERDAFESVLIVPRGEVARARSVVRRARLQERLGCDVRVAAEHNNGPEPLLVLSPSSPRSS